MNINYENKDINIKINNEYIQNKYNILFKNFIYCEIIGIELWGQINRLLDLELNQDDKKLNELICIEKSKESEYPNSLFKRNSNSKCI